MSLKTREISFFNKNKSILAFIFIFIVAVIYIHPVFFGKVDVPYDIRNVLMYPWRYHAVDKKIEPVNIWKINLEKEELKVFDNGLKEIVLDLKLNPGTTKSTKWKLDLSKDLVKRLRKVSKGNYYISFDFKPVTKEGETLNFGLSLVDDITGKIFNPPVAISPLSEDKSDTYSQWYKAYFNINLFTKNLTSLEKLNNYSLLLTVKNNSRLFPGSIYLKSLVLACDDYSRVKEIHNYFINDVVQMFVPFREYFSDSIKKRKLPFWNNYIFSGTEFLAEPQVGYFHPLYFLTYLIFDHFTAHSIITFVSLVLSGIGAYLLASFWGFGFYPSLLSGVVYMFQPFNVTWFSYEHMIMNSATLPFLLLAYEKNLKEDKFINKYLLFSAILLGLILLSGHLQYIYYTILFFLLFVVFKYFVSGFLSKQIISKQTFSLVFIFLVAFMIGMIVIIPFFPLFSDSHRIPNSISYIKETSFPLRAFLGLVYPYHGGHPSLFNTDAKINIDPDYRIGFFNNYVYFGLIPFLFSILAVVFSFRNKLTLFFLLTIVFSLLLCTGSPLFFILRSFVPGFKELQHFRFLEIFSYSAPFLAGIGFKLFIDRFYFKSLFLKVLSCFFILVTVIDLIYYSSYFVTWSPKADYKLASQGGSLEFLMNEKKKSKELFRILPFAVPSVGVTKLKINVAQPNTLLPYGLEEVSGYSSFVPKDIYYLFVYIQSKDPGKLYPKELSYYFTNPNIPYPIFNFKSKILDLLNVKYFLVPSVLTLESEDTVKVFSGDASIYENKNYLPRAFFVPSYKVIESPKETIIELDNEGFDPRKEVILMAEPAVIARSGSDEAMTNSKCNIDFLKYDQNNITLRAKVNHAGFLVLGHNLNNNWKVKIGGIDGKHYQANLVQRAVYLPKEGEYLIEFYYFPRLFIIGGSMSILGVLILIILAVYLRARKMREELICVANIEGKIEKQKARV